MNLVVWLVVGGLMGVIGSLLTPAEGGRRVATNVLVGIAGALVGGWLLSPLIGGSTVDQIDFSGVALLVSFAGATTFLAVANLAQRPTGDTGVTNAAATAVIVEPPPLASSPAVHRDDGASRDGVFR